MAIDFTSVNSSPVRHLKTPFSGLGIAANQDFSILVYARFEENTNSFWYFLSSGPASGTNINLWRQAAGNGRLSALINSGVAETTLGDDQTINNGEFFLASFSRRNGLASLRLCKVGSGKVDGWINISNTSAYTAAASDLFFGARQDLDTGREWHGQMSDVIICHDYGLTADESIAAANGAVLDQLPFWQYRKFHTDMSFDPSTSAGLSDLVSGRAITAVNSGWGAKTDDPALLRRYSQFLTVPRLFSVPVVSSDILIDGSPAALTLTGTQGAVNLGATINGAPSSLTLAGQSGQVDLGSGISGVPASLTITGLTGQVDQGIGIDGVIAALSLSGVQGQVSLGQNISIDGVPASLTLTGATGQVDLGATINGIPASLIITGLQGDVMLGTDIIIDGNPAALTLGGVAGLVGVGMAINGTPAALTLTGVTGDVVITNDVIINATPAALTLTGMTGTVTQETTINGIPATLTLSGQVGQVSQGISINSIPADLQLSGLTGDVMQNMIISGTPASLTLTGVTGSIAAGDVVSVLHAEAITISLYNKPITIN